MARFEAGTVVIMRFPFSDLASTKLRPALVPAALDRGDFILCQITSDPFSDSTAGRLAGVDVEMGGSPGRALSGPVSCSPRTGRSSKGPQVTCAGISAIG
jgi:hypothetical protein